MALNVYKHTSKRHVNQSSRYKRHKRIDVIKKLVETFSVSSLDYMFISAKANIRLTVSSETNSSRVLES